VAATRGRRPSPNRTTLVIAIIGAVATILGGIFAGPIILRLLPGSTPRTEQLTVRVAESSGASIAGAKVLLFFQGGPLSQITDTNGSVNFTVNSSEPVNARLVVETNQYKIYEQEVQIPRDKTVNVHLENRTGSDESVIFHVVEDAAGKPIVGAKILLLVQGDVMNETTDSNGVSKFTLSFPAEGKLDVKMSINTKEYQVNDQNITLTPNKVQDIRLSSNSNELRMSEVTPVANAGQLDASQGIVTEQSGGATVNTNKNGVAIEAVTSNLVDRETGFRVSSIPSDTAKDKAEVQVVIVSPDNHPFVGTYVSVRKQKTDVNNQPVQGDQVVDFRTDDTGSAMVTIDPGTYGIWPDIRGYSWKQLNFNQKIEAGKKTTITIVPSRFVLVVRRADKSLVPNSYVAVSTLKKDVNGKLLIDQTAIDGRIGDTGDIQFDLTPGNYAISIEVARGEDWGFVNNVIPPAAKVVYNMTLGRIRIEARDDKGDVSPNFYASALFQKKDANNKNIFGDIIVECRTDNTGVCNLDLTPGVYAMRTDAGNKYDVAVKSGETVTLKNTDFVKP
jgi:hypothetical protein